MHLVAYATPAYWMIECDHACGFGSTPQGALFELVRHYPAVLLEAIALNLYKDKPVGAMPYASAEIDGHLVMAWVASL